jgi:hypothetical protein
MGDSYSAGNGAGDYGGVRHCRQSERNYGHEFQRLIAPAPIGERSVVRTVACSGDVAAAFAAGIDGRPPQLAAVDPGVDLILLTIGGNDLRFAQIVRYCLVRGFRDGSRCDSLLRDARRELDDGTISTRLRAVLGGISERADPMATIVLLGYPYLEGDTDYSLSDHGVTYHVGARLRGLGESGDALERGAAGALDARGRQRVVFVPTKALFEGPPSHELYGRHVNRQRWFVQPWLDSGLLMHDVWYHPNRNGWQQEAQLLASDPRVPEGDATPFVGGDLG